MANIHWVLGPDWGVSPVLSIVPISHRLARGTGRVPRACRLGSMISVLPVRSLGVRGEFHTCLCVILDASFANCSSWIVYYIPVNLYLFRCDCREQLKMSLEYIRENGGAIIYLQQEGRGIGLANKVAAYALQDVGLDTVDANTHLGFPEDARQYGVVPSLLADMGIDSIRLMTNNPRKIERLRALGIDVLGTIPMVVPEANPYNRKYLETKKERMSHTNFGSMLSSSPDSILSSDYSHVEFMLDKARNSVAEDYINEGEEMAANAITSALMDDPVVEQSGVNANEDGYCFGRESVEQAIAAVARGELIVVVDDESRENEGDFIMAADKCTPERMAEFIRYSSGVICIGMEGKRMDELKLPPMVVNNEDPKETAFSVSVDATSDHGKPYQAAEIFENMQVAHLTHLTCSIFRNNNWN